MFNQLNNINSILNDKIKALNLSVKTFLILERTGINTISDLLKYHQENNIKNIKNLSRKALREIECILLSKYNIILDDDKVLDISKLSSLVLSPKILNELIEKNDVSTIDKIHSLDMPFEYDQIVPKEELLEYLYRSFDAKFISCEFYEKIEIPSDFINNEFVLFFTRIAVNECKNKYNKIYTIKEIRLFLEKKLLQHKKEMLCVVNGINKKLKK